MAELNEQQLMLLNALVYVDIEFEPGQSVSEIVTQLQAEGGMDNVRVGGGMTSEDVANMLNEIASQPELMNLTIDSSVRTEIVGVCFVDGNNEATIAFRGTGPAYAAWDDNCQGGYLADTDMQREALEFARNCAGRYDDITVSGHSKGGNMAQYVTILMGNEVDRCVSFDGQGFGEEFWEKYGPEIEANRHKIRSVSAYNDYVNILLKPVATEENTVYLDNDHTGMGGHHIYSMYENSNNKINEKGEYETSREQAGIISGLDKIADLIVAYLESEKSFTEFMGFSIVGIIMGLLISDEMSGKALTPEAIKKVVEEFLENLEDYIEYNVPSWLSGILSRDVDISVDTAALREYSGTLRSAAGEIDDIHDQVRNLQRRMATNVIRGISIGGPLQLVLTQLSSQVSKLQKLANVLTSAAEQYDTAEQTARDLSPIK